MGGSVLPITIRSDGKVCLLFGKERDTDENPGWSDFGGGQEKGESPFQTAVREGSEELTGFLGDAGQIRARLDRHGYYTIDHDSVGYSTYRVHVFPMEYDPWLETYYNANHAFLATHLPKKVIDTTKLFEKPEVKWVTFSELQKMIRKREFRAFYQHIAQRILDRQHELEAFARTHLRPPRGQSRKQTRRKRGRGKGRRHRTRTQRR